MCLIWKTHGALPTPGRQGVAISIYINKTFNLLSFLASGFLVSALLMSHMQPAFAGPLRILNFSHVQAEATSSTGADVDFGFTPQRFDGDSYKVPVSASHASGDSFPLGVTTVTLTVTGPDSTSVRETFTVTVVDTTAPTITTPLIIFLYIDDGTPIAKITFTESNAASSTDAVSAGGAITIVYSWAVEIGASMSLRTPPKAEREPSLSATPPSQQPQPMGRRIPLKPHLL